jgi:DNA adenine methylase
VGGKSQLTSTIIPLIPPPYWDCENYYGKGMFAKADFERLHGLLEACKGKWIVSINDVPEIRKLFKGFDIRPVSTSYSVAAGQRTAVTELLIANFKMAK